MRRPSVQIVLDDCDMPGNLKQALSRVDAAVGYASLADTTTWGGFDAADAVVVVPGPTSRETHPAITQLLGRLANRPGTALVMGDGARGPWSTLPAATLPLGSLDGVGADELTGRLSALIEYSQTLSSGHYGRLTRQVAEAEQVQKGLLPRTLPQVPGYRLRALYRPAGALSGDIYGCMQNAQHDSGLWLADVCGHGLGAAMMTGFVKHCMAATTADDDMAMYDPKTMLEQLNDDLLREQADGGNIVAAGCITVEAHTGYVTWARSGLPYPIYVRPGKGPETLTSTGSVLGALKQPNISTQSLTLARGEALILHTDGLDWLFTQGQAEPNATLEDSRWYRTLGTQPITRHLAELDRLYDRSPVDNRDDLSMLIIERVGPEATA